MKRCFLLVVLAAVLFGCTAKTQPLPQTSDPETGSDVTDIPNNNEPIEPPTPSIYFELTTEQQQSIREIIVKSGVFDDYNPKMTDFVMDFFRNTIGMTKQGKDFPTMLITRYEDVRFGAPGDIVMVYSVQRFYRENVDFTYVKDGLTKKANLEFSYYINQNNATSSFWYEQTLKAHLYVSGASGQTNYPFYYDAIDRYIYVKGTDEKREVIEFTEDLQDKILMYMEERYRKYTRLDEQAMKLARDIVGYVDPETMK